ncbi:MAG: molybdate ABC transporter substrate-binding protein [Selenomonadaceae bacterium]|nr:molybdate ABC transporter substrate-binding protein [Selenomonadaceae bacterium]
MKKILALMMASAMLMTGCGGGGTEKAKSEPIDLHIAAAASLTDVMKELAGEYEKENSNIKLIFNFGSSGALQQAIENGGQTDIFFSAAQKQMNALEESKNLAEGTRSDLLINKVVLIVPADSNKDIKSFNDLAREDIQHIALGEPKGVPVGQYSEEILTKLNILDAVKAKAVYGSDVRQVLSWVESGEADCGVVYATDAAVAGDKIKIVCEAPEGSHKPVIYPVAIIKDSKQMDEAKKFLDFVKSDKAKAIFEKYGFEVVKK